MRRVYEEDEEAREKKKSVPSHWPEVGRPRASISEHWPHWKSRHRVRRFRPFVHRCLGRHRLQHPVTSEWCRTESCRPDAPVLRHSTVFGTIDRMSGSRSIGGSQPTFRRCGKAWTEFPASPDRDWHSLVLPQDICDGLPRVDSPLCQSRRSTRQEFNYWVLNDVLAVNPLTRYLTSLIYKSEINGLSKIYLQGEPCPERGLSR